PDPRGGEGVRRRDVRAGREIVAVDRGDDLRLRQVEEIGVALDVERVVAEALAPEIGLAQPAILEQHAPGAVEHGDALPEELSQTVAGIHLGPSAPPDLKSREPAARGLFRRFLTWSP